MRVASTTALEGRVDMLRRLGALFADGVPDPLFVCDPSGVILLANAAMEGWLGCSREAWVEKRLFDVGPFERRAAQSWFAATGDASGPRTENVEARINGQTSVVRVTLRPIRWGGETRFAVGVLVETDPSPSIRFPYRFSDGSRAVARYASTVAHDMRNPLTGISTGIQYLRRTLKDHPEHLETIDEVLGEIRNLDGTIQALTGLGAECEVTSSSCDPGSILQAALSIHRRTVEDKRLTVSFDAEPSAPLFGGDRERLTGAFSAVLERAFNAALEDTSVRIHSGLRPADSPQALGTPGGTCCVVRISCVTGEQDARQYVEAFDPSCPARDAQVGLYLAGQTIEAHGGVLDISGTPGRTIHFAVVLPRKPE